MNEHMEPGANGQAAARTRRMTVTLVAALAIFGAAGVLSLTGCKQDEGSEMSSPAMSDIPHGCSPATTPCQ